MSLQEKLVAKIQEFEAIKKDLTDISNQIGALSERQRGIYNHGLTVKGAIDALVEAQQDADAALATSKTAQLTLPVGVSPIVPETAPVAPIAETPAPATPLEVVQ